MNSTKTATLTLLFAGLAGWAKAQSYTAAVVGRNAFAEVPAVVAKSFHRTYRATVADSCTWQLIRAKDQNLANQTYWVHFQQHGWGGEAWLDGHGKGLKYDIEASPDTLPKRVKRKISQACEGATVGKVYATINHTRNLSWTWFSIELLYADPARNHYVNIEGNGRRLMVVPRR